MNDSIAIIPLSRLMIIFIPTILVTIILYSISLAGMIFASSKNSISLEAKRLKAELRKNIGYVYDI